LTIEIATDAGRRRLASALIGFLTYEIEHAIINFGGQSN
jgi:hypothetical protein